jgi:hypothetical protein
MRSAIEGEYSVATGERHGREDVKCEDVMGEDVGREGVKREDVGREGVQREDVRRVVARHRYFIPCRL